MAGEYVFNLMQMTRQYDRKTVLDEVSLAFFFGAKIGVIGGNGSGKSSLLRILAGIDQEYTGTVHIAPNQRIGYLPQEPVLDAGQTVQENVDAGVADARAVLARYDELCELLGGDHDPEQQAKLEDEFDRVQNQIDRNDLWELDNHVERAMDALRLPTGDTDVSILSGGERRRVAICRLLLSNPDVLLLDEPTNHLDAESTAWLETYLKQYAGTLVVVTHDRYFLSNVTEWILELENAQAIPYKGNYEQWLEQKQERVSRQAKQSASRQKLLQQELAWVRLNASSRLTKNKARLNRYEELAAQQADTREDNLQIRIPPGPRLGDVVVRATDLGKAYGERSIMEQVSFDLPRGGIVGVIGGNGAGKTTLFRMIVDQEEPTSGRLEVGPSVVVSYVDQLRDALQPEETVFEAITGGVDMVDLGGRPMNSRAYCARFNFRGADQQKPVGQLSGGERNRVHLAKLLKTGGNLLLLDEPSNDLDVDTLRSLEEGLLDFGGCAVVISHDRWFLDRIATHILAFEDEGGVTWFEGNYAAYHEHRRRLLGEEADRPKRIKFRAIHTQ